MPEIVTPDSVQEFDVIPGVLNYISNLGVTPKRFKPVDYGRQHVCFCFAIGFVYNRCLQMGADGTCTFIVLSVPLSTSDIVLKAKHMNHHVLRIPRISLAISSIDVMPDL